MRPRGTRSAHGERPSEFKARAIDLCRSSEGLTIADVARGLGIGTKTFRKGGLPDSQSSSAARSI
jgi:transposase-like protein